MPIRRPIYFTKEGKPLSRKGVIEQEFISSLAESDILIPSTMPNRPKIQMKSFQSNFVASLKQIENKLQSGIKQSAFSLHYVLNTPKFLMPAITFGVILTTFAFVSVYAGNTATLTPQYSIFSAKPLTLGSVSGKVYGQDSRAEVLDRVFEKYKCPIAGLGNVFVEEADKNNIPFWIVPAISFQESNCGKKTPKTQDKSETYNAWGWAVWGNNVKGFDNWEHGIKVLSKYINTKFYSKGTTELCEIMKIYTPPSDGSWCNGVTYFKEVIENYATPAR